LLKNKDFCRYFIIIDDLWASLTWDIVHQAFPDDKCCSRILITTESGVVAQRCCGFYSEHIFNMDPLSDNESRKLFFSIVQIIQSENFNPGFDSTSSCKNTTSTGTSSSKNTTSTGTLGTSTSGSSSLVPPTCRTEIGIMESSNLRKFTFSELKGSTRNFRADSMLGEGVYCWKYALEPTGFDPLVDSDGFDPLWCKSPNVPQML
jgi:hypothetical protein